MALVDGNPVYPIVPSDREVAEEARRRFQWQVGR